MGVLGRAKRAPRDELSARPSKWERIFSHPEFAESAWFLTPATITFRI